MGLFSKLKSKSKSSTSSKAEPSSSSSPSSTYPTTTETSSATPTNTGIITSQASPPPADQATTAHAPGSSKTPVENNKESNDEDKSDDELDKTGKTDRKKGKKEVSLRRNILATITLSAVGAAWSV